MIQRPDGTEPAISRGPRLLVTTSSATVPDLLATAARIFHLVADRHGSVDRPRLVRDPVITAAAAAFPIRLTAGADCAPVYQGVPFLFAGVILYAVMAARRQRA